MDIHIFMRTYTCVFTFINKNDTAISIIIIMIPIITIMIVCVLMTII